MSKDRRPSSTEPAWERGRPARRSIDGADADETPALPGAVRLTLGTNNVYALPGDAGVTLIDAGPDYEGAWEELHAQLHAHNLDPAHIHTVLLTHHHLDHAGLAARWQAAGARILIGAPDAPALAMPPEAREHERTLARQELLRHGVPPDTLAPRPSSGERYTRWAAPLRMTPVQPDGVLDDGARISQPSAAPGTPALEPREGPHVESRPPARETSAEPNLAHPPLSAAQGRTSRDEPRAPQPAACTAPAYRLQAIAAPGHTPGTLLLLDTATGALFTGDHILPRMAPTSGIQFEGERRHPSLPTYLASLRTTRALAPSTTAVYPGHGEPFADLAEAVDWTVRLLEQRARRALTQLRHGPATAYALAQRMFPHLGPRHLRPTMAEVIGLLDLLAERSLARADQDGTLVTWHALTHEHSEGTPPPSDRPPAVP